MRALIHSSIRLCGYSSIISFAHVLICVQLICLRSTMYWSESSLLKLQTDTTRVFKMVAQTIGKPMTTPKSHLVSAYAAQIRSAGPPMATAVYVNEGFNRTVKTYALQCRGVQVTERSMRMLLLTARDAFMTTWLWNVVTTAERREQWSPELIARLRKRFANDSWMMEDFQDKSPAVAGASELDKCLTRVAFVQNGHAYFELLHRFDVFTTGEDQAARSKYLMVRLTLDEASFDVHLTATWPTTRAVEQVLKTKGTKKYNGDAQEWAAAVLSKDLAREMREASIIPTSLSSLRGWSLTQYNTIRLWSVGAKRPCDVSVGDAVCLKQDDQYGKILACFCLGPAAPQDTDEEGADDAPAVAGSMVVLQMYAFSRDPRYQSLPAQAYTSAKRQHEHLQHDLVQLSGQLTVQSVSSITSVCMLVAREQYCVRGDTSVVEQQQYFVDTGLWNNGNEPFDNEAYTIRQNLVHEPPSTFAFESTDGVVGGGGSFISSASRARGVVF